VRPALARLRLLCLLLLACGPARGTIGAVLAQDSEKRLFVREVPAGLAADRAGLRPGDEVLLIDGRDARQMSSDRVHAALSGEVGDPVKLTLIRDGEVVRVRLHRTPAARPSASVAAPPP
jgi:C-terminal processing protease CtpA/Prc